MGKWSQDITIAQLEVGFVMYDTGLLFKEKKNSSEIGFVWAHAQLWLFWPQNIHFGRLEIMFCKVLKKLLIHPSAKVHHPQKLSVHLCALESIFPRLTPVSHRTSFSLEKEINALKTAAQHHKWANIRKRNCNREVVLLFWSNMRGIFFRNPLGNAWLVNPGIVCDLSDEFKPLGQT